MSPRQIVKDYWPIVTLLLSGAVAWTTLKNDVNDSLRVPRFEKDSINDHYRLDGYAARLDALEQAQREEREWNSAICRAVGCKPPTR